MPATREMKPEGSAVTLARGGALAFVLLHELEDARRALAQTVERGRVRDAQEARRIEALARGQRHARLVEEHLREVPGCRDTGRFEHPGDAREQVKRSPWRHAFEA